MPEPKDLLRIADLTFPIEGASLMGHMSDPYWCDTYNHGKEKELFWHLEVSATPGDDEDFAWYPTVSAQSARFPSKDWRDLKGEEYRWDDAYDEQTGREHGGFYVHQHTEINQASLKFIERDGFTFGIQWDGLCDIYWDEPYDTDVEFSLQTSVSFLEVVVYGSERDTPESVRERFGEYLIADDFEQGELKAMAQPYQSGVGVTCCTFRPK